MASVVYNSAKRALFDSTYTNMTIDIVGDAGVKIALVTSTYTVDIDAHTVFTDITNELSATNYSSGGQALDSKAIAVDTANNRAEFDAADEVFTAIGNGTNGTFTQIVLWDDTPTNDPLIAKIDCNSTTTNGGNITIEWDAQGILQFA